MEFFISIRNCSDKQGNTVKLVQYWRAGASYFPHFFLSKVFADTEEFKVLKVGTFSLLENL